MIVSSLWWERHLSFLDGCNDDTSQALERAASGLDKAIKFCATEEDHQAKQIGHGEDGEAPAPA